MLLIKKSSLFFSKAILLQCCFYNKNILAFYDYFFLNSLDFILLKNLINLLKLNFFILSSKFINFFFNLNFFSFLKPGVFLIYTNIFEEFLNFDLQIKNIGTFFLIAFYFKGFFFNLNFLSSLNFSLLAFSMINLFFFFFNFYIFYFCFIGVFFFYYLYIFLCLF